MALNATVQFEQDVGLVGRVHSIEVSEEAVIRQVTRSLPMSTNISSTYLELATTDAIFRSASRPRPMIVRVFPPSTDPASGKTLST